MPSVFFTCMHRHMQEHIHTLKQVLGHKSLQILYVIFKIRSTFGTPANDKVSFPLFEIKYEIKN